MGALAQREMEHFATSAVNPFHRPLDPLRVFGRRPDHPTNPAAMESGLFGSYAKEYAAKSTELSQKIEGLVLLSAGDAGGACAARRRPQTHAARLSDHAAHAALAALQIRNAAAHERWRRRCESASSW